MHRRNFVVLFCFLNFYAGAQCPAFPESYKTTTLSYVRLPLNQVRFLYKVTVECNSTSSLNDLFVTRMDDNQVIIQKGWELDSVRNVTGVIDPCVVLQSPPCHTTYYYHSDIAIATYSANGYLAATINCCRPNTTNNLLFLLNKSYSENFDPSAACNTCQPCLGTVYNGIASYIKVPPLNIQNSGPQFTSNDTIVNICKGHYFSYQLHATDPDNDSVAYHFSAPRGFDIYYYNKAYYARSKLPFTEIPFKSGYSVQKPAGDAVSINETTGVISGSINNTGTYILTISALEYRNGTLLDSAVQDLIVKVLDCDALPKPIALIPASVNTCNDFSVSFPNNSTPLYPTVNWNNTTFQWDFGDGDTSHQVFPVHTFKDTGVYNTRLIIFPGLHCADTAFTKTIVYPTLKADFINNNNCSDEPALFTNMSSSSFGIITTTNWQIKKDSDLIYRTNNYNASYTFKKAPQTYTVLLTVKNNKGCEARDTQYVNIYQSPYPLAFHDTILSRGASLQLKADDGNFNNGGQYLWTPPIGLDDPFSPDPTLTSTVSNTYYVTIKNSRGCIRKDSVHVEYYTGPDIYVPNAFTPNNDGINDVFRPFPVGISTLNYFRVFNRQGQIVFQTSQPFKGWDGNINGIPAVGDIYVWQVSGIDYMGKKVIKKGTVLLIR